MPSLFNNTVICPVLIGRQEKIESLHALIHQVAQGQGQVVLISGEAGIGKSRLVVEVKRQAQKQGFHILQGSCFPTDRSTPYAPLLDLFRSSQTTAFLSPSTVSLEPFARELALLQSDLISLPSTETPLKPLDPEQDKRRRFVTITHFLTGVATKQPVLIILEDLHWSDEASLEFLHVLARRCLQYPLLLVLTYRNDETHPGLSDWLAQLDRERLAQEYILAPLSRSEVDAMLRSILDRPNPLPASTVDGIYELTEGNPFFIEELLKSLITAGVIDSEQKEPDLPLDQELTIPRSIQGVVQQRLAQISDSARQVLVLAAVAGRRFDFSILQQILHKDELELLTLMKELIAVQLVVEESEDQFAFRHALTREAIYRQLLLRERKVLHRKIAETIEQVFAANLDAHFTELAFHHYEAGAWEKVVGYARRAGERALALFAPQAAIDQFTLALKATYHLAAPPLAHLYRLRGQAYDTLGNFEQARSDYERAVQAAHDAQDGHMQWQAIMDLGFLWAGRDYERSGSFFREAVQLAQERKDPVLYARSLNRLGNWLINTGQVDEGLQSHQHALEVFQRQQDRVGMAETFDRLGQALAWNGDIVRGAQQHEQAIALFKQLDDKKNLISILPNASLTTSPAVAETVYVVVREPETSARDAIKAAELARQIDWPAGESYAEFSTGLLLASFGQFGRGLAHAFKGLQVAVEIEHQQWVLGAHCCLGQIYVLMLEPDLALHHLNTGLPMAEKLRSAWWMHNLKTFQALAHLMEGQGKYAEAALMAAMPREQEPRTLSERRLAWVWGELALAQGEPQAALDIAERLIATAPGALRPQPIPRLLKLKGEALVALKRMDEAVEALEQAERGALERREAPLLWQIHGSLARVYRRLKREQEERRAWLAAREGIDALAKTIDDAGLREHFSQRAFASLPGARPASSRRAISERYGGLTERERGIAALIAQGKSNREIAEQLVVSERTVESHVGNILNKLGVASRTQVVAWVVAVGLDQRT